MSMSRSARRLATATVLAASAVTAAAAPSQAASLSLQASCDFPLFGPQPVEVALSGTFPSPVAAGSFYTAGPLHAAVTLRGDTPVGFGLVKASTLEGTAENGLHLSGAGIDGLDIAVPLTIPKTGGVSSTDPAPVLPADGALPTIKFPGAGTATFAVSSFALNLLARRADGSVITGLPAAQSTPDSDGDFNTFDVPCTIAAGQPTTLATVVVTAGTSTPTITSLTPSVVPARVPSVVVLRGTNLDKVTTVRVGDAAAAVVTRSKTQLVLRVPALRAGKYTLIASAANGTAASTTLTVR